MRVVFDMTQFSGIRRPLIETPEGRTPEYTRSRLPATGQHLPSRDSPEYLHGAVAETVQPGKGDGPATALR